MGTHPIFESDFDCLTEQNVIFNLCSDSLSRGISGELFRAVDGDLDNQVSVRLVGLDFLKVQKSDMGLTLMPSEIKYDFDRDYDGRVNASDGIYTNSSSIKVRVQSKCMKGIGFKKSVYRGI